MVILGLDPGSRHTGYGLIEERAGDLIPLGHGVISPPRRGSPAERLHYLHRELDAVLERWRPDAAVLEAPFHGVNARALVMLAQARGALLASLGRLGVEIVEYAPAEIKGAVAGNGRADKAQVALMVKRILRLDGGEIESDASDALAAAVCYAHRRRMDRLTGSRPASK